MSFIKGIVLQRLLWRKSKKHEAQAIPDFLLLITATLHAQSAWKFSSLFGNNLVMQQGINAAVFGTATVGKRFLLAWAVILQKR